VSVRVHAFFSIFKADSRVGTCFCVLMYSVLMYRMWHGYAEMCCEMFCSVLPVLPVAFQRVCVRVCSCVMVNVYHVCNA